MDALSCILLQFLGSFHDDPLAYEERKICAGMISQDWREALNATPLIWTCALIDNYTDPDALARGFARSGILPLHLHIDLVARDLLPSIFSASSYVRAFIQRIIFTIDPYLPRCNSLALTTSDATTTASLLLLLGGLTFPTLTHLHLNLHHTTVVTAHSLFAMPPLALSQLDVTNGFVELQPALYAGLTTLIMRGVLYTRWAHFRECLPHVGRLVTLELYDVACFGASSYQGGFERPPLVLPFVSQLKLSASFAPSVWILGVLHLPALRRLHLVVTDSFVLSVLSNVARSVFEGVCHLELSLLSCTHDTLVSLLRPMSSLLSLDARSSHPTFGPALLSAMRDGACLALDCSMVRLPPQNARFVVDLLSHLRRCERPCTWFLAVSPGHFLRIVPFTSLDPLYSSRDESLEYFST